EDVSISPTSSHAKAFAPPRRHHGSDCVVQHRFRLPIASAPPARPAGHRGRQTGRAAMHPLPSPSIVDAFRLPASWASWRRTTATAITAAAIRVHFCGRAESEDRTAVISFVRADGTRAAHTLTRPIDYPRSQLALDAFEWF